jgi:TatD DNase family protein
MGLIDTHTHLESFWRRGEGEAVLARARAAGVEALITVGTSREDWGLYRDIAAERPGFVHYTVGLHPCAVEEDWAEELAALPGYWREGLRPVALGEIGLDRFHLPKEPAEAAVVWARQVAAFRAGLEVARELACPVVIHSRGAFRECVEMIDASGVEWARVVFHCFVEGAPQMSELVGRGGVGSFGGVLTYKSAEIVRDAARTQGLARFLLETDAPYLTPVPHRGKPNEVGYVRHTAEFAASEVFGVSVDEVAAASTAMARRFFGL